MSPTEGLDPMTTAPGIHPPALAALAFAGILAGLLGAALFTLIGIVRGDLADLKKTLDDVKEDTALIPGLVARLDRLETEGRAR